MEGRARTYNRKIQKRQTNIRGRRPVGSAMVREETSFRSRSLILFLLVSVMLLFIGFGFFSGMVLSGAPVVEANQQLGDIQYKVIEIEKGDSLWSIAKANMNPGFDDIYDYIHEVKRCNQLGSDKITAGNYLLVPYYE